MDKTVCPKCGNASLRKWSGPVDGMYLFVCECGEQRLVEHVVPNDATPAQVTQLFHERLSVTGESSTLVYYLGDIKTVYRKTKDGTLIHRVSKEVLEELLFYCNEISSNLRAQSISPVDHDIAGSSFKQTTILTKKSLELANGLKLNRNDRRVVEYMQTLPGYASPTEIGKRVFTSETKLAAKLRTLRAMAKLMHFKKAAVDKNGHYKLLERIIK